MTNKEKLKKIKELADAMYTKMQNLTTDTSGIRKAMEEYRQFIINEYNKEDSVSEELEEAANKWDTEASFNPFYMVLDNNGNPNEVRQDYTTHAESFKAGAKWQKEKDESTTEDLGMYINELSKQFPEVSFAKLSRIAVRVAKWQKEHLLKPSDGDDLSEPVSEDLEKAAREYSYIRGAENIDEYAEYDFEKYNAFKAGAKWQKEQIMSKAIDFIIVDNNAVSTEISTFPYVSLGTKGDTVKLIIINQD